MMVAAPAVLLSVPPGKPNRMGLLLLEIFALPALLLSRKKISPPFLLMTVAVPAVLTGKRELTIVGD